MKKIIITLAIIAKLTTDAFATGEKVSPAVLNEFNKNFTRATEVTWTVSDKYYKATFTYYGYLLYAWYNTSAELLGVTRNISLSQLPLYLQKNLEVKYAGHWITDIIEESGKKGFRYFITLENADQKIFLRSDNGGKWEVYHKSEKS